MRPLDQRIKNAGEDVMLAKTDDERARAVEAVDELKCCAPRSEPPDYADLAYWPRPAPCAFT